MNKCLNLDPAYDNAAIAVGVSLSKLERYDEAEVVLKAAAKIQPENALVKQNLSATLARAGKFSEALPYFRQAASLAPNNPAVLMGLANCLDSMDAHRKEALTAYKDLVKRFPDSQFAEKATQILNRAGQADLRKVVDGGYGSRSLVSSRREFPRRSEPSVSSSSGFTRRSKADLRICCQSRKATSHRRFCIDAFRRRRCNVSAAGQSHLPQRSQFKQ